MIQSDSEIRRNGCLCKISAPAHPERTSPDIKLPMTMPRKKTIINPSEIIKQGENSPGGNI